MGTRIPLNTKDSDAKGMAEKLEMSTAEIGLSVRTTNCLEERGIFTVNDLLNCARKNCWQSPILEKKPWKKCIRHWRE